MTNNNNCFRSKEMVGVHLEKFVLVASPYFYLEISGSGENILEES